MKFIKIFISSSTALFAIMYFTCIEVKAIEINNSKLKLSFGVMSDVHIKDDQTIDEANNELHLNPHFQSKFLKS